MWYNLTMERERGIKIVNDSVLELTEEQKHALKCIIEWEQRSGEKTGIVL